VTSYLADRREVHQTEIYQVEIQVVQFRVHKLVGTEVDQVSVEHQFATPLVQAQGACQAALVKAEQKVEIPMEHQEVVLPSSLGDC